MSPSDEHVDRYGELASRRRRKQRCVISDSPMHRCRSRRSREESRDRLELVHAPIIGQRPSAGLEADSTSVPRSDGASLSSTPLTNLYPSVPPYALASSIDSLITTRKGISARCLSSH